ncbi:MAG: hypothetical protein H0X16_13025 [Chloroflexi bacterium]|nr:hypothetical protein [Chloroflexota bacterium]
MKRASLSAAIPSMPFRLLDVALREEVSLPALRGLEEEIVSALDSNRIARGYTVWSGGKSRASTNMEHFVTGRDGDSRATVSGHRRGL